MYDKRIVVPVSTDMVRQLKVVAEKNHTSMNQLVRLGILKIIKENDKKTLRE